MCVSAGRGRDEEPRLPETQEDPGGAEHRQDGKKRLPETLSLLASSSSAVSC